VQFQKVQGVLNFLKSSTLYIFKNLRDVGEVSSHNLESIRSVIIDVGIFLDLVNVIESLFEIPLLQMELPCFIPIVLEVLCLFRHVDRRGQNVLSDFDSDFFRK